MSFEFKWHIDKDALNALICLLRSGDSEGLDRTRFAISR